ncbi:MAG: DEAD/DEAH box helicase family protein [Verrucomicrobiales bacterium]|jgi:type III restriction enzyme|nr:DEAD/DEAH box helicase family protein [Verrucomicrobiales bacterium]
MKLQFDAKQEYQLAAVNAVVDLFDGQPLNQGDFEIGVNTYADSDYCGSMKQTELGFGNFLALGYEQLLKNLRAVQERNDLEADDKLFHLAPRQSVSPSAYNFSVEMETGTGKTYVYLRTIFELHKKYGFAKYIIVVPSVAIREGVQKNLEITAEHFKALYNNVEFEYFVYDAKKVSRLRQFAVSNKIQILIINIDAFRKNFAGTDDEQKSNVIHKEADKLSGRRPIEFVQAVNPIVIIDEPQSVDNTDKAMEAIQSLRPLCTLRYSATHKNPYNLVYSLDPIRAFELRLVKQITVAGVTGGESQNDAYVKLLKVYRKNGIKARLELDVQGAGGPKRKTLTVKSGDDLYVRSAQRANYRHGFIITEINGEPEREYVRFGNGTTLTVGRELGGVREEVWRAQIKDTVRRHLDKELTLRGRGIKVLSLFFIDRVANYRDYDADGRALPGKFAAVFEQAFAELSALEKYRDADARHFPVGQLHDGYFASDKKGFKDTNGATKADDDTYAKIMRDKERLLSLDEPLRFIFSHSALREGWDNPNVFQICTLNETQSAMKKRQEIGRGLRLPVNQNGERVFDENINKLLVVANESYESFAENLQNEYEEDCGVTFGKVSKFAFAKLSLTVDGADAVTVSGRAVSEQIFQALTVRGILGESGKIQPVFDPRKDDWDLGLPPELAGWRDAVIEVLKSYQLERHIQRDTDDGQKLKFKKKIERDEDFKILWQKISGKTTYSVEYQTATLVTNAVKALKGMAVIEAARVRVSEAQVKIDRAGIDAIAIHDSWEQVKFRGELPDVIAYLQGETELTRSTIARILIESGRLKDFLNNPQKFMDEVAAILKRELQRLIIDGIKYEKIAGEEYDIRLFEEEEIMSYLANRLEVRKSVYDAIVYQSETERKFAEELDRREDIKLFVKLPAWFQVETPIGPYNPDWAIVKHHDTTLYLVRETKGTKNLAELRPFEQQKIRCGEGHFKTLEVDFATVTSAGEI